MILRLLSPIPSISASLPSSWACLMSVVRSFRTRPTFWKARTLNGFSPLISMIWAMEWNRFDRSWFRDIGRVVYPKPTRGPRGLRAFDGHCPAPPDKGIRAAVKSPYDELHGMADGVAQGGEVEQVGARRQARGAQVQGVGIFLAVGEAAAGPRRERGDDVRG